MDGFGQVKRPAAADVLQGIGKRQQITCRPDHPDSPSTASSGGN
jgi:hypothetical protein